MGIDVKNMSNTDLTKIQKELAIEFDSVKMDLIKLYDYWASIEKKYHEVNNELNDRFGVNNR